MKNNQAPKMFHGLDIQLADLLRLKQYIFKTKINSKFPVISTDIADQNSHFQGRGIDFDEARIYQAGDDIRNMDWRVTARTGKAYTKIYKQERNRNIYVIADFSKSMHFGTRVTFKSILSAEIIAFIAWKSISEQDRVGAIFTNECGSNYFQPSQQQNKTLFMFKQLLNYARDQSKNDCKQDDLLSNAIIRYQKLLRNGSQLFVISDFNNFNIEKNKNILLSLRKHQTMTFIHLYDILEQQIPKPNIYTICNGEQKFLRIDASNRTFRKSYHQNYQQKQKALQQFCQQLQIQKIDIATDANFIDLLSGAIL